MDQIAITAASGLHARMEALDLVANNLANSTTGGFKLDREFYSLFSAGEPFGLEGDPGTKLPVIQKQWTDFTQGTLQPTGNSLDLALSGKGFFVVNGPSGPLYTRNGSFQVSAAGALTTADGYAVQTADRQTIQTQSQAPLDVAPDGTVTQDGNVLGQLQLVDFQDRSVLQKVGNSYFGVTDAKVKPIQAAGVTVEQGKVENSNVAPAESAVRLVGLTRQFEMLQKAISITADMNKKALDDVARVTQDPNDGEEYMIRALFSAASGMTAQQMNVDNIANNLANANTAGFKQRRAQFQDLLYQNMVQPGASASQQSVVPTGLQLGLGTRAASNEILFTQGDFSQTNNPLDLVIQGNGFFQVQTPTGALAYTRSGQFQLNREGQMVDANGNLLQPPITLPQNAQTITIATDGTVSYNLPNQTASQSAGQIQLATFVNPAGLNSLGQNLYQPTNASGDPVIGNPGGQEGIGTLLQGYTEQSNVSVVDEFVNLIVSQRAYEANSKVVKAADEMYQQINNLTR